ncbi:MAG: hypothetical protein M5U28_07600 [Sandaracinaceae bacterium]|nr:hypothetical protein [Sandaracinaceae bacterium]
MQLHLHDNPALTVAIAVAAGMLEQTLAQHLRLPRHRAPLLIGVVLGPDVANVVQPQSLGSGFPRSSAWPSRSSSSRVA